MPKLKPLPNNLINPFLESMRDDPGRARELKPKLLDSIRAFNAAAREADLRKEARYIKSQEEREEVEELFKHAAFIKGASERR